MRKNKLNKYIIWGLLLNSGIRIIEMFIDMPDAVVCFVTGIGISLLFIGLYTTNNDLTRVRKFKKNLVQKLVGIK